MAGGMSHGPGVAVGTQGAPLRAAAAPILLRRMPFLKLESRSETGVTGVGVFWPVPFLRPALGTCSTVRARGEWMCVGFLPLSCAVPVSGYSCLPFSDIGQEIGARARAEGRETWISRGF